MASRKEQKERLKAERMERERQAQAAERRKRLVGMGAGGVLLIAAIAALVVVLTAGGGGAGGEPQAGEAGEFPEGGSVPEVETADLQEAAEQAGCELKSPPNEGNEHVEPPRQVEYESNPPTSGTHYTVPADEGAYTEAPPEEALLHALEHGRILVQYSPDAPESVVADLKALYDEDPYHKILAPNTTNMPYEVAATTWGELLGCPQMNEDVFDAIRAFSDEYVDTGPEGFIP